MRRQPPGTAQAANGCLIDTGVCRPGTTAAGMLFSLVCASPVLPAVATAQDVLVPAPPSSSNDASEAFAPRPSPKGVSPEAWAHIKQQVEDQIYAVRPDPHDADSWLAENSAQHLSVRLAPDGVSFTPENHVDRKGMGGPSGMAATPAAAPFRLRSHLDGTATQSVKPVVAGNRIEYRHGAYTEWYVNDARGFEQGWTVVSPISGNHASHIRIDVRGARTVAEGADSIRIEDEHGKLRYRYAGLQAWDADHRLVPAALHRTRTGGIDVSFDDRGARYPITVDPTLTTAQEAALTESAGGFGSQLAVGVDGDTVVVGAYSGGNNSQGQAFIFSRNQNSSGAYSAGAWGLVATLNDPYATASDEFGSAVAIQGDTIVVTGNQNGTYVIPALHIFERNLGGANNWGKAFSYLGTTQQSNAFFVPAVYGNTVVAGVTSFQATPPVGSVVIFDRNAGGRGTWGAATILTDPQNQAQDYFGFSVAVNGSTLVVGAFGANSQQGRAYVYSLTGSSTWSLSATLSATPASVLGYSVAVNGDTVVIGSGGQAFIYGRNQGGFGSWGLEMALKDPVPGGVDFFGWAVAVDGDFVVVGSPPAQGSTVGGAAYAYARNAGGAGMWGLAATETVPSVTDFGTSVAVSGDTWITGSDSTVAYIYDLSGGSTGTATSILDPSPNSQDKFSNAISVSGDTLVIG